MIYLVTVLWFQICFLRSCQVLAIITSSLSCSPRYCIFKQDHLRSGSFAVEFKDHLQSGIICGATRGSFKIAMLNWMLYISLTCVSSETNNLQRVFLPGGESLIQVIWVSAAPNGMFFSAVLVCNRVWFVHSSLELGMFFRRISYFFIIWR